MKIENCMKEQFFQEFIFSPEKDKMSVLIVNYNNV